MLSLMFWPLDYDKMNNMEMAEIHHVFPTATMKRSGTCMQEKAVTAMTAKIVLKIRHDELRYDNCNTNCTNNVFMLTF
jgi:transcriptional antiterminator Rof (Rho-off)